MKEEDTKQRVGNWRFPFRVAQLTQKTDDPSDQWVKVTAVGGHDRLLLSTFGLHQEAGHFPDQYLEEVQIRLTLNVGSRNISSSRRNASPDHTPFAFS